jgi:hypothetical protein
MKDETGSTGQEIMAESSPTIRALTDKNPLRNLLLEVCVPDEAGVKSIAVIARYERLSSESVQKWCRHLEIPPNRAMGLVKKYAAYRNKAVINAALLGEVPALREITIEEFFPFIFTEHAADFS